MRFLLTVGTVEPRKNHALLLQTFDRLEAKDAGLVIVGRKGWMADDVLAALTSHPAFGKRLFWYEALDDAALVALYRHAHASVLPSQYEGYGLPVVEALSEGCATIVSDAGSMPHVAAGAAETFPRGDGEALFAILDRLYRDPDYHAALRKRAAGFRPTSWREAGISVALALEDIATGASHDFAAPVTAAGLSLDPPRDPRPLAQFGPRQSSLHRPHRGPDQPDAKEPIEAVARRQFPEAVILTDDAVAGGELPADHQARNTWLRKTLYRTRRDRGELPRRRRGCHRAAPARTAPTFKMSDVHIGYYFLEDMSNWLAGSPAPTSFDGGLRNVWRVLAEAAYPTRAFSSHMPQIINKSLANEIFGRFVLDRGRAALDEWSLYFNVASQLYPAPLSRRANRHARLADAARRLVAGDPADGSRLREPLRRELRARRHVRWASLPSATATPRPSGRCKRSRAPATPRSRAAVPTRRGCSASW